MSARDTTTPPPATDHTRSGQLHASDARHRPRIWTGAFTLLCASTALGYFHQGVMGPVLPLYVSSLGYSELIVGLVVAAFSVTSFVLRPFIGQLADTWSVRGVISVGGVLLGTAALATLAPFIFLIGCVNAIRGIGWAALNTGLNTLLAHTAPAARRAEAASYLAIFHNTPSMLAPPVALWILSSTSSSFSLVFILAALAAFAAAGLAMTIPRPLEEESNRATARAGTTAGQSRGRGDLIDRGVLLATLLLICLTTVQPAVNAFVPLYAATQLGLSLDTLAWYYVASGTVALLGRLVLGRIGDRLGRGLSLVVGFGLCILGLIFFALASDLVLLIAAGITFTIGGALHQPSTLALAIDRANPRRRGRAMASYSLGYQVGAGFGAVIAGALVEFLGYSFMYAFMVLPLLAGVALTAANWSSLRGTVGSAGH